MSSKIIVTVPPIHVSGQNPIVSSATASISKPQISSRVGSSMRPPAFIGPPTRPPAFISPPIRTPQFIGPPTRPPAFIGPPIRTPQFIGPPTPANVIRGVTPMGAPSLGAHSLIPLGGPILPPGFIGPPTPRVHAPVVVNAGRQTQHGIQPVVVSGPAPTSSYSYGNTSAASSLFNPQPPNAAGTKVNLQMVPPSVPHG